jgi:hypothetical protein
MVKRNFKFSLLNEMLKQVQHDWLKWILKRVPDGSQACRMTNCAMTDVDETASPPVGGFAMTGVSVTSSGLSHR